MAIKDNKSNIDVVNLSSLTFAAPDTPQFSESIDVSNYDNGITFFVVPFNSGVATTTVQIVSIQDSDDNVTFTDLATDKYIGVLADMNEEAATTFPTFKPSIGIFSNRQYVRAQVQSVGNDGVLDAFVMAYLTGEEKPRWSE